jgi:hypothetical protein
MKKIFIDAQMECPNCAMRLQALEAALPRIIRIDASYRKMEMAVAYD